jgi:hypothetical protein
MPLFAYQEEIMTRIYPTVPSLTGKSDQVHIFQDSTVVYVLSINLLMEYIGLEIFDAGTGEEYYNIYLQFQWELEEYLGSKWRDMTPQAIVRRLVSFLL